VWTELDSDWLALDCEVLPWSAKAQALLRETNTPHRGRRRGRPQRRRAGPHRRRRARLRRRRPARRAPRPKERVDKYRAAYRGYCWPVNGPEDHRIAPFHLLASEGGAHVDRDHVWHMELAARICAADPAVLTATPYRVVDVEDPAACESLVEWWEQLTARRRRGHRN
jgi:protein phosphatase